MDDESIFDQLFRLLQSSGPVNWKIAREVTKSLAGSVEPVEPAVAEEYRELAHMAELRIDATSDLPARAAAEELNPTDRATWAADNQQAFRLLVEPLADKLGAGMEIPGATGSMGAMLQPLGPALLGMQAGTMIGFMSQRILGQFDSGIPAMDHEQPYLVVPNVAQFSFENSFDDRQVRLWAAMHEMAFHRLMAIEWLRGHFVSLITSFYDTVEFDVSGLMGRLGNLEDPAQMDALLSAEGESGVPPLLRGDADPDRLAAVQAFIAFVEGYGDHLVRAAGAQLMHDLDHIEAAYSLRRSEPDQAEQFLQQMAGLELQRHRASDAAAFCVEVKHRWGEDALARVWEEPDRLPTRDELTDPVGWAARVLLD